MNYRDVRVSLFKDINDQTSNTTITLREALGRIYKGESKDTCEKIRSQEDKTYRNRMKKKLPCVMFCGEFTEMVATKVSEDGEVEKESRRTDESLTKHSGLVRWIVTGKHNAR